MRPLLASLFKHFFSIPAFTHTYFGLYKRLFYPANLFKGVTKRVLFRGEHTLDLDLEDWIPQRIYFLKEYEEKELRFIENFLQEGDVFFDIGANIGLFSLVASEVVGVTGKVVAFEPFSENFQKLKKHIAINQATNIVAEQMAVSDELDSISLFLNEKDRNSGMVSRYASEYTLKEDVASISIDQYLQEHELAPRLIKIDIEGGELLALKGMEKTLQTVRPTLLIEINTDAVFSAIDVDPSTEYLKSFGYEKYFLDNSGAISTQPQAGDPSRNFVFSRVRYG